MSRPETPVARRVRTATPGPTATRRVRTAPPGPTATRRVRTATPRRSPAAGTTAAGRRPWWPATRILASVLVSSGVAAGLLAGPVAGSASAASASCPKVGRTLATSTTDDGRSRVWQRGGRTYGCTTIPSETSLESTGTVLLSRKPVSRVRLDGRTVAWTTRIAGRPARLRRVSAVDLAEGERFLHATRAVPAGPQSDVAKDGSVDGMRVADPGFVAWIANGSTVVVAGQNGDGIELPGPPASEPDVNEDGTSVAAVLPRGPGTLRRLRASLRIDVDLADPTDSGFYTTTFSWSADGVTTTTAVMTGSR
jgi:hypothetical protein